MKAPKNPGILGDVLPQRDGVRSMPKPDKVDRAQGLDGPWMDPRRTLDGPWMFTSGFERGVIR